MNHHIKGHNFHGRYSEDDSYCQNDVVEYINSLINAYGLAEVAERYCGDTFAEMAGRPEFADIKAELLRAEKDWFKASDA